MRATYGTAVHFPREGVKADLQLLGGVSPVIWLNLTLYMKLNTTKVCSKVSIERRKG